MREDIKILAEIPDEKFIKKLGLLSDLAEAHTEQIFLEVFEHFKHNDTSDLEQFLINEKVTQERTKLISKFFQKWKAKTGADKPICSADRETLLDLQWKLSVKAGGSGEEKESMYIQTVLITEVGGSQKRHHFCMDIDTFYDFLHKINTTNSNLEEILSTS